MKFTLRVRETSFLRRALTALTPQSAIGLRGPAVAAPPVRTQENGPRRWRTIKARRQHEVFADGANQPRQRKDCLALCGPGPRCRGYRCVSPQRVQ